MSSSFVPNEETDFIPENILLTGGAGKYQCFIYVLCERGIYWVSFRVIIYRDHHILYQIIFISHAPY